ncbi:hypothetical protein SDC9_172051 [bioreactor metagenome]|uniref:Uncharacterized protein n=1 Tax=bioreactor metagenome TaxID=1076179 RepID=A0A645GFU2_9ZZZZ
MRGFHDHGQSVGSGLVHDQIGQLDDGLFLDLRAPHDPVHQPRVLRQADHVGVLVGQHADPDLAHHRAEMVATGASHRDWADDHQLVKVLGVREFGDRRRRHIAALEHLVDVHLRHTARGVVGVVVAHRIDDHAVEHALHLLLHLVEQLLQLARLDEFRDVVVGVEALARSIQPLADLDGYGRTFIVSRRRGLEGFFVRDL